MGVLENDTWQGPGCGFQPLKERAELEKRPDLDGFIYTNEAGQRFTIAVRTAGVDESVKDEFLSSVRISMAAERIAEAGEPQPVRLIDVLRVLPALLERATKDRSLDLKPGQADGVSVYDLAMANEWNWPAIYELVATFVRTTNARRLLDFDGVPTPVLWAGSETENLALTALHLPGGLSAFGRVGRGVDTQQNEIADGSQLVWSGDPARTLLASVAMDQDVDGPYAPGVWRVHFAIDPDQSVASNRTDVWIIDGGVASYTKSRLVTNGQAGLEYMAQTSKQQATLRMGQDHHCSARWMSIRNTSSSMIRYELWGDWIQHIDDSSVPDYFY